MQASTTRSTERGVVLLALLVAVVVGGAVVAFFFVMRAEDTKKNESVVTTQEDQGGRSALQLNAANTQRKTDVSRLLAGVYEFYGTNLAQFPVTFSGGQLVGADSGAIPSSVNFDHYDAISFAGGEQAALTADALRLVTRATCETDGTTAASTSRNFAVQWAQENAEGTFTGRCEAE
jgi:hypothetical protein